jgi:hypothetical protein
MNSLTMYKDSMHGNSEPVQNVGYCGLEMFFDFIGPTSDLVSL